ncbi:MAG: hypothetical protein GC191_07365 [Azospirillum sp.]|nr:hypothetical protein [Azospirillum sp.]
MHRVSALSVVLLLGFGVSALAAERLETELAKPVPGFDQPRRIVLQMSSDDERSINNILWNAVNLQKFYGQDSVEIAVIVFGAGMKALYRDGSPVRERVESLQKYGIVFIGCGNTMETTHHSPDELIEGVQWVQTGIAEIVERQLRGWTYIRP